jgi:hypothetical protein
MQKKISQYFIGLSPGTIRHFDGVGSKLDLKVIRPRSYGHCFIKNKMMFVQIISIKIIKA